MATSIGNYDVSAYYHPWYNSNVGEWSRWRDCYKGGIDFRNRYLERFTDRESDDNFSKRQRMTPIPAHAKAAINEIRDSIFQRLSEISRLGGSEQYQLAVKGFNGGVDRRGKTMNSFVGTNLLTELLIMGRVGVYVDNTAIPGPTLAATQAKPYLYSYRVEDIMSWAESSPEDKSEYSALLLREQVLNYDANTLLPTQYKTRFRRVWINPQTKLVNVQFYDSDNNEINQYGEPSGPIELGIDRVPFVMFDIGDSLIKDPCEYQIALMNLCSSDVNYAIQANFPFYTEQADLRSSGTHLKQAANPDGTATAGGQGAHQQEIHVGVTKGRQYDKGTDRPGFIHPSPEPLRVSLELQDRLESNIRKLVHLAVENMAGRASAEAKAMENQGLEAGLSWIGLVLEAGERKIADYWAAYEARNEAGRKVCTVAYPASYSLKSDGERTDEANKLYELMAKLPGREVKREIAKLIVTTLLGGRIPVDKLQMIYGEIEASDFVTSDLKTIIEAHQEGLVGDKLASIALGFPNDEYLQANKDHAARIARIQEAQGQTPEQTPEQSSDPGARGLDDLSADPDAGSKEKDEAQDTTTKSSTKPSVRGKAK